MDATENIQMKGVLNKTCCMFESKGLEVFLKVRYYENVLNMRNVVYRGYKP